MVRLNRLIPGGRSQVGGNGTVGWLADSSQENRRRASIPGSLAAHLHRFQIVIPATTIKQQTCQQNLSRSQKHTNI